MANSPESGGFLHLTLPSPAPTTPTPSSASSILPAQRSRPLKAGGTKESALVQYVDSKLLQISGRYEKRFGRDADGKMPLGIQPGYESFGEAAKDLESILDVIWVSGTPSVQIPFLLNIALATCSYMPAFPFSPKRTMSLLHKLDVALSSLLQGCDVETGEPLPGIEGSRGKPTTTDKVRIRGIVSKTRIAVFDVASKSNGEEETQDGTETDAELGSGAMTDDAMNLSDVLDLDDRADWEMDVARVYERTLVELGLTLDAPDLGHDVPMNVD